MTDWPLADCEWLDRHYQNYNCSFELPCYQEQYQPPALELPCYPLPAPAPMQTCLLSTLADAAEVYSPPQIFPAPLVHLPNNTALHDTHESQIRENPRMSRNKAEKHRRDTLNQSIAELATMLPLVHASTKKVDKTGVLRLTAHYLRAHNYVFGEAVSRPTNDLHSGSVDSLLQLLNGFLLTTTYTGLVVVVSKNVQQYLGYSEIDLLGHNILNITHPDDQSLLREQLMPKTQQLGPHGELLIPNEPNAIETVAQELASEKRRFLVRFKKLGQRSEPSKYVTCYVEGSLRKSDKARTVTIPGRPRCWRAVRRARARSDNPCTSGNDVVFIGVVRPTSDTFKKETEMESFRMEYRTRHSVDGEIIQCEQRISLVTGYMMHEVKGVNAMNFMHRDDVRWVIVALREMYDHHRLYGESCYRLLIKNGQFIYMRTRGKLEVESNSRAVTSFVCTNTVVDEKEGEELIKMMKQRFTFLMNNNEEIPVTTTDVTNISAPVEDPILLKRVILHLVNNLPEYSTQESNVETTTNSLAIIPPTMDRIINAIYKIKKIFKFNKTDLKEDEKPLLCSSTSSFSSEHLTEETNKNKKVENVTPHVDIGKVSDDLAVELNWSSHESESSDSDTTTRGESTQTEDIASCINFFDPDAPVLGANNNDESFDQLLDTCTSSSLEDIVPSISPTEGINISLSQ